MRKYWNQLKQWYGSDPMRHTCLSLQLSLAINLLFGGFQFFAGLYYRSVWYPALGSYNMLLATMRFLLLKSLQGHKLGENPLWEYRQYRRCAIILMLTVCIMAALVRYILKEDRHSFYNRIMMIASAAYTFWMLGLSIRNIIYFRKYRSPILSAAKTIGFSAALMSIVSLGSAMIITFSRQDTHLFRQYMVGGMGLGVCIVIFGMAVWMLHHANREIKRLKGATEYGTEEHLSI